MTTDFAVALLATRDRLIRAADESVRYARHHMPMLGSAGAICLIGYYFVWKVVYPADFDSLAIRLFGALVCIPAVLSRKLPKPLIKWLPVYWTIGLTYIFPFTFGYLLTQNAAQTDAIDNTNLIWPLQYVVALVIFILLINDGILATLLWLVATAATLTTIYALDQSPNMSEIRRVYLDPMPLYGFILIVGSLAIRNRKIIELEKLRAISNVTSNIAHELRTPFLGIRALAQGIGMYLPRLLDAYDLAIENSLPIETIRRRQLDRLRSSLREIEIETNHSNSIIDRLLLNASERPVEDHVFEVFTAQRCVLDALSRYPFVGRYEHDLVCLSLERNFTIDAPHVLVIHVLFNLFKNGLYYVHKAEKGELSVRLVSGRYKKNAIIVEDTGTGIAPQNLRRIFDRFYTTTGSSHASGIGLSFCKMVMEGLGGSIKCESKLGVYTRLTMTFPRARRD